MKNDKPEIVARTFEFALRLVRLCSELIRTEGVGKTIGYQLLRSGTAVGAIVDEAQAAPERSDFALRFAHALKEARQTNYWLRLLIKSHVYPEPMLEPLLNESTEIMRILGAITANVYRSLP
jgi:four helix bundle protein